jgi:hypothetical protein
MYIGVMASDPGMDPVSGSGNSGHEVDPVLCRT